MATTSNWPEAMRPLLHKYKNKKHPLDYHNVFQLMVMVVLSAQSTDDWINKVAPKLFADFTDMEALARATPQLLFPYLKGIRNFGHKANWLVAIAHKLRTDKAIPLSQEALTDLPGIGRKSANVIMREAGVPPEGVMVDLHVVRVAPRLGIVKESDPKKMEQELMQILPKPEWDAGMAMSFLGREICRPKPECERCLMNTVCAYYNKSVKGKPAKGDAAKASAKTKKTGKPGTTKQKPKPPVNKKRVK